MRISVSGARKTTTNIPLPNIRLPRRVSVPRNPPGWGTTNIDLRARGIPALRGEFNAQEPAGDPAPQWQATYPNGTRPEWAVWWGLTKIGLDPNYDFEYQAKLSSTGAGYYSTIDFLVTSYYIGIDVQGKFWHYGQGSQKIFKDIFRVQAFASVGVKVIFIDEPDALRDPVYYVKEALAGVDHSHVTSGRKNL
jgi:hypothetical protein